MGRNKRKQRSSGESGQVKKQVRMDEYLQNVDAGDEVFGEPSSDSDSNETEGESSRARDMKESKKAKKETAVRRKNQNENEKSLDAILWKILDGQDGIQLAIRRIEARLSEQQVTMSKQMEAMKALQQEVKDVIGRVDVIERELSAQKQRSAHDGYDSICHIEEVKSNRKETAREKHQVGGS